MGKKYSKYRHSKLRDAAIEHLCQQFDCDFEELKRDHSDVLSYALWKHLNFMIKIEKYVRGLDVEFHTKINPPEIVCVNCYYCGKVIRCYKSYYEKRKGRVFCNKYCRDNCKHARQRYINGESVSRKLLKIFDQEEDSYQKRLHKSIQKRIQENEQKRAEN